MRFKVVERRCYDAEYIVEADSSDAAGRLEGTIIEEDLGASDNSWAYNLLSVEAMDEEEES